MSNKVNAINRSGLFQVLASLYLQLPDKEKNSQVLKLLKEGQEIFIEIDFSKLISQLEDINSRIKDESKQIEDIKQEYYNHLFVPVATNYIPPYESAVRDASKEFKSKKRNSGGWKYNKLWGDYAHGVALCYKSVGFDPSQMNIIDEWKQKNIPDHIGFELAFMSYLCEAEHNAMLNEESSDTIKQWYNLQTQFLVKHLNEFSKSYYIISKENANSFYLSLIETVVAYVNWDITQRNLGGEGIE